MTNKNSKGIAEVRRGTGITPPPESSDAKVLNRLLKNKRISKSKRETVKRHRRMVCKTYELKIDKSHVSKETCETLRRLFLEAKWFYNDLLERSRHGEQGIFDADYKRREVLVRNKDGLFETRELKYLSSQMRQEIIQRTKRSIYGLSKLKKKGHKVGALKFKSRIESIPLRQYGVTYDIIGGKVRIQNIKQRLRVRGLGQIPPAEVASATLEQRSGDYFVHVTTYQKKVNKFPRKSLGIDAGIKNQLTLSNGLVVKEGVPVTRKIRHLHRELSKRKKYGKNWLRTQLKLNREYDKIANQRADIRHKIASRLTSMYDAIAVQDDNIRGWQRMWGRKVTVSAIGGIMSDLRTKAHTPVEVKRFVATTARCCRCGARQEVGLEERIYECHSCGFHIDRDLNAAINVWRMVPAERRELTPVDTKTATELMEYFNSIPRVSASLVEEAGSQLPAREAPELIRGR